MMLSCLRCMASKEDSGTVMKRSCQSSFHVNRREDKITQACSWLGEATLGLCWCSRVSSRREMLLPSMSLLPVPACVALPRSPSAAPVAPQLFVRVKGEVVSSGGWAVPAGS